MFLLLPGVRPFMIHNTRRSLCLEDSPEPGEVLLKKCVLDSEFQQWVWGEQGRLVSLATSRCLSAQRVRPVRTEACPEPDVEAAELWWDCDRDRLISRNRSMLLSIDGRHLTLSHDKKHSKWRSLDEGDICQDKLRSRRASKDRDEFEVGENAEEMSEEQREYLRWFYRTEDPTMWKFVLLGLAFVCLLIGFMLLGMGAMANKNRKKIAKYKAAAALLQKNEVQELQVISYNSASTPTPESQSMRSAKPRPSNGDVNELKPGDIVVTWRDGNTSCLYPEPAAEAELPGEEEEEKEEEVLEEVEKQEEFSTTDLETEGVKREEE